VSIIIQQDATIYILFISANCCTCFGLYLHPSSGAPHITESKVKKGKAVPLQAWSGPEGSRKLRFPDFMTTAQDGGKVVSLTHLLVLISVRG